MQKKVLMGAGAVGLACLALRKHLNTATYEGQSLFRTRKTAFLGGVATAMAGVAAVCCVGYLRQPRMERVFAKVLPMLRANEEVRTAIGSNLRPGSLRMHLRAGGWQLRSPFYTTPSTQVVFQVHGDEASAMVSLGVATPSMYAREVHVTSAAVDFANGERLILKGAPHTHNCHL